MKNDDVQKAMKKNIYIKINLTDSSHWWLSVVGGRGGLSRPITVREKKCLYRIPSKIHTNIPKKKKV